MHRTYENGIEKLFAENYSLIFPIDRPFVFLETPQGERIAELFIPSSVHSQAGQDDTTWIGAWEITETADEVTFSLPARSSIWAKKTYRICCQPHRFEYEIEVEGSGRLEDVHYFGGYYSGQVRWGSGYFWSGQCFRQGFNPEPNADEIFQFSPAEGSVIDLMGVPLPGKASWFFTPPPFCFPFEIPGAWLGLGVIANPGGYRFTEYRYSGRRGAFHLELPFEGHTVVNGCYKLPAIGFDFGVDEYQAIEAHVQAANPRVADSSLQRTVKPGWWYEPIFCGWGAQCYIAATEQGKAADFASQAFYEKSLHTLEASDICPGIVVLDDKWQASYGENRVDTQKWPDLPGFIRAQHARGRKVLLWLKAWDPEGLPAEECIRSASDQPLAVDPTNPLFEARLRKSIQNLISSTALDADGFKIDFTGRIPSGPGIQIYEEIWGLELMKRYLHILYDEAKRAKPDALVMTHTPHPYLADVLDMVRLNDINKDKDVNRAMTLRARVAKIACPNALIDTDNWPIPDRASWRKYIRLQPELGVPSLYYTQTIDSTKEPLEPEDYQLIREVWTRHRARK